MIRARQPLARFPTALLSTTRAAMTDDVMISPEVIRSITTRSVGLRPSCFVVRPRRRMNVDDDVGIQMTS